MVDHSKVILSAFKNAQSRNFPKGQILIYEGDSPTNIYYISSGYVKVYSVLSSGDKRLIFVYQPGDVFPLTSYISRANITRYFYECMTNIETNLISADQFSKKIKGNIDLGEAVISYTSKINELFLQRINDLTVNNAKQKVVNFLLFLVDRLETKSNGHLKLNVPLTVKEIGDMCGVTRETATIQLGQLRQSGVVTGHSKISIDVSKLKRLRRSIL